MNRPRHFARTRTGQPAPSDAAMLTREDIGYGPARPYEFGYDPAMPWPREKRRRSEPRPPQGPPPGHGPYHRRLGRRTRPDHWIRADVEEALFVDTWVDADRITVMVEEGIVTLIGTLPSHDEVRRAIRDAAAIPGIRHIRNRLEVEA